MSSGRHCTSTCSDTSAGTSPCSMHQRAKSKSVCEADGKPISISLKPMSSNRLNMRALRSWPIGSISAWLPSRRSTEHQIGALSMRLGRPGAVVEADQRIGLVLAAGVGHAAGGADFASFVHRLVLRRTGGTESPRRGDATIRSSCGDCDWQGASASNRPPGAPSAGPAIADKAEKQQRRGKRAQGLAGQGGRAAIS